MVLPSGLAERAGPLRQLLAQWALAEVAPGRLVPWLAVAFGFGVVGYFTADREPAWWAACGAAIVAIAIAYAARLRPVGFPLALGLAAMAAGFAAATLKAAYVAHPVLQSTVSTVTLAGFVEVREERERSDRVVIHVHRLEGRPLDEAPDRVRLAVRKGTAPMVGSFVELKAHLSPPLAPLRPGGYDFARGHVFPADRRFRLRARQDQNASARRSSAAPGCVTPSSSTPSARPSTNASASSSPATRVRSPRR